MPYYERREIRSEQKSGRFNLANAYEQAVRTLDVDRINPEEFTQYNPQAVGRHMQYVRDKEAQFAITSTPEIEENKKLATVEEAIIHEQVELGDWLGPDAQTIVPSRYDDIAHGIDGIIRFHHEGGRDADLGLAIDVTFSRDIRDKLNEVMNNIRQGKLTEITYYAASYSDKPDEYIHCSVIMPRVVIGMERQTVENVGVLWLAKDKKALGKHPIQHLLAREIMDQLAVYDMYARSYGNPNGIGNVLRNVSRAIEQSLKQKKSGGDYVEGSKSLHNDKVFGTITKYLDDVVIAMK